MTDESKPVPKETFSSPEAVFRSTMRDHTAEWQLAIRNQLRIAACPDEEVVKPSEANQAFSNLARYVLKLPERTVEHNVTHQHRLTLGGEALAAMGIQKTRMVVQLPDGTTDIQEEFALGAEERDAEVVDGDG